MLMQPRAHPPSVQRVYSLFRLAAALLVLRMLLAPRTLAVFFLSTAATLLDLGRRCGCGLTIAYGALTASPQVLASSGVALETTSQSCAPSLSPSAMSPEFLRSFHHLRSDARPRGVAGPLLSEPAVVVLEGGEGSPSEKMPRPREVRIGGGRRLWGTSGEVVVEEVEGERGGVWLESDDGRSSVDDVGVAARGTGELLQKKCVRRNTYWSGAPSRAGVTRLRAFQMWGISPTSCDLRETHLAS